MIYFIQAGSLGPIKIGRTNNGAKEKLKELQVGCPEKLYLVGTIEGNKTREGQLHYKFKKYQIRGEWYEPKAELTAYIYKNANKIQLISDETFTGIDLDAEMIKTERKYLKDALDVVLGNKRLASKMLNISLRSLRYKIDKYGL